MKKFIELVQSRKPLVLFLLCALAVIEILYGSLRKDSAAVAENKIIRFVEKTYSLLDKGEYAAVAANTIECSWKKENGSFAADGLVGQEACIEKLADDFGVGGWRIRFVTLEPIGYEMIGRDKFSSVLRRESQVLDYIDPTRAIDTVHIVTMKGHVTGRCAIVNWVLPVPVVLQGSSFKILLRGTPQVYSLIHNEQWFKPVNF